MKKLLLSLAFIAGIVTYVSAQTSFGIQAGVTSANMKIKEDGENQDLNSKFGFTAGLFANVGLSDNFSFRPALNYTQKGGKDEFDFMGTQVKSTIILNYLEIPLNFVYTSNPGSGFFIGAGPSLSFGLSGRAKTEVDGQEDKVDVNFGDKVDELKGFEFGGNLLAGYLMTGGISIAVNYNMGFSNISNAPNSEVKNRYLGVRIGYAFGGDK